MKAILLTLLLFALAYPRRVIDHVYCPSGWDDGARGGRLPQHH